MKNENLSRLEPCAVKVASTVLRGDWLQQCADPTRRGEQSCKCITGDSLIQTSKGLMRLDDIVHSVTDSTATGFYPVTSDIQVYTHTKTLRPVTQVYIGEGTTYRVTTEVGDIIEGLAEHKLLVREDGEDRWVRLDELTQYMMIPKYLKHNLFAPTPTEQLAYPTSSWFKLIAWWQFEFNDWDLGHALCQQCGISYTDLPDVMKSFHIKVHEVPECVLWAPRELQLCYLRGVLLPLKPEYSLRSNKFVRQISAMLENLGILVVKQAHATLSIAFSYRNAFEKLLQDNEDSNTPTVELLFIESVEETNRTQPVYDLVVESDHSYIANGIVCHNSTLVLNQIARAISTPIPHILYFDYEGCVTLDTTIRVNGEHVPFSTLLPSDLTLPSSPQWLDHTVTVDTLGESVTAKVFFGGIQKVTTIVTETQHLTGSQHPVLVIDPDTGDGYWCNIEQVQVGDTILIAP